MLSIGLRNLNRDRLRMAIAVSGVVFAVVLVTLELGLLFGLVQNASLLIDRSSADIWVMTVNVKTFDFGSPMNNRTRYKLEAIPGVDRVEEFNVSYSTWNLPDGGVTSIQVVALPDQGELSAPLQLTAGSLADLHNTNSIIVDEGERAKLGGVQLGDRVELNGVRAEIVGFTRDMRSFTTTPYVFTSLRRGESYGLFMADKNEPTCVYYLLKTAPGANRETVCRDIEARIPGVEALTTNSFSWRTRRYWLIETGMGIGFVVAAVLGLFVGGVILSQSLYAMTLQKLPEFGVLKAMGATMRELARPVLEQGLVCGVLGLILGLLLSFAMQAAAQQLGTTILISMPLVGGISLLTLVLCCGASLLSIVRLYRVDPVSVFQA